MSSNNIETSYKGKQIGALRRHICTITKICVLPTEGLKIVSSSKDHNIMIWNLEFEQDKISGKMIRHLYGHVDEVTDMSINANGKLLVSASVDKTLILWDLIRGEILTTMEGHKGPVTCCWINAETPHVISGSLDGKVRVWSMDGKLLSESPASLEEHGVTGVAVLQLDQSKKLVFSNMAGAVSFFNIDPLSCERYYTPDQGQLQTMSAYADTDLLVSGWSDRTVRMVRMYDHKLIRTVEMIKPVLCVSTSPCYDVFAVAQECSIYLYHLDGPCFSILIPNDIRSTESIQVSCLTWSANATYLYVGYSDCTIRIFSFPALNLPALSVIGPK